MRARKIIAPPDHHEADVEALKRRRQAPARAEGRAIDGDGIEGRAHVSTAQNAKVLRRGCSEDLTDSGYAWWRLLASLALSTIGGVGMWSVVVALPAIQAEFGIDRGDASLPYTATMVGFALGGVLHGPARRPLRHPACRW